MVQGEAELEKVYEEPHIGDEGGNKYITLPTGGGTLTVAAGDLLINLKDGTAIIGTTKVSIGKIEPTNIKIKRKGQGPIEKTVYRALSFFIKAIDNDVIVFPNATGGGFTVKAGGYQNLRGIPITTMIIRTTTSTKIACMWSVFKDALLTVDDITPATISTGGVAVLTTATRLSNTSIPAKSVSVIADSTNALAVYVGDSSVTVSGTTRGVELTPGSSHDFDIDDVNKLYTISVAVGNNVMFSRLL